MKICRKSPWLLLLLGLLCFSATLQDVHGQAQSEGPSESECRPYIEKALKELETSESADHNSDIDVDKEDIEDTPTVEITTDSSVEDDDTDSDENNDDVSEKDEAGDIALSAESTETDRSDEEKADDSDDPTKLPQNDQTVDDESEENVEDATTEDNTESSENVDAKEESHEDDEDDRPSAEVNEGSNESKESGEEMEAEGGDDDDGDEQEEVAEKSMEDVNESEEGGEAEDEIDEHGENSTKEDEAASDENENDATNTSDDEGSKESEVDSKESTDDVEIEENDTREETEEENSVEDDVNEIESEKDVIEVDEDNVENLQVAQDDNEEEESKEGADDIDDKSLEESEGDKETSSEVDAEAKDDTSLEETNAESEEAKETNEPRIKREVVVEDETHSEEEEHVKESNEVVGANDSGDVFEVGSADSNEVSAESGESAPEEDLINDDEIPADLRGTDHIGQLLKLNEENEETEKITQAVADITLRDLKKLYEHAIKPLEVLYKYRDLSNRHFGDAEIFSKPLVLFMGPWSGGKSSIINYLVDNEYKDTSLKTGAEPSPAYFNILMYGEETEVLDGTQLAADYTFSGLQKFGQGLEERLRGMKLPKKLLEKINIVEIPGILEVRKQVSRVFPFNDACQWFIDRADIIFLVYDPSKLDVGPETEAILDQLKGREHQTRIILNKADQVKPEELMRVQGALIWNISPLMSSAQPPIMYTASLWSIPYEHWAPVRLLQAQERAFLRDLRSAVDKRIDNKISSARRFAVRVRNHAKMVDCYLTTYYNHKSVFGNRKQVSDAIIERPQDYHIYEGLSTLTNISRYDLPDPDVYRGFFRLNPLYDFQQLSATCTYFRGCPINRLDVAIAYDLPELVGRHKRRLEAALAEANPAQTPVS